MTVEVFFLGTSAGLPTTRRGLAAVAVRYKGHVLLFDCGEGTQRQMMKARLGFSGRMRILITHMHGDHFLGLPGLLQTMSLLDRRQKLDIHGPKGLGGFLEATVKAASFHLGFPLEFHEVKGGLVFAEDDYKVYARLMNHSVPNYAYAFVENEKPGQFHPEKAEALKIPRGPLWRQLQWGKAVKLEDGRVVQPHDVVDPRRPGVKIVYSGDTKPSRRMISFARGADLLIHDCTFDDGLIETAAADRHGTPTLAAAVAREAEVKQLVLTHISARYQNTARLRRQAAAVFPNVLVARDLMRLQL